MRSGRVLVIADGEQFEAGEGDIVVVGPRTNHKFVALDRGPLHMVCIHASPRMIQTDLE